MPTLTVEIHSATSEFQLRISTSMTAYCVDPGLAFTVRILGVASGFVGRADTPECACCSIACSHSPWKFTGSRVGLSAGQARWNAHAAQSPASIHRGNSLGREWVCRPDRHAGTRMPLNRLPAFTVEIHWGRERVCRPGRYAGTRMPLNRLPVFTVEIHWVASGFARRTGTPGRACRIIACSHPPWNFTGAGEDLSVGQARRNTHAA
ncbi:hypothetical protein BLA15816_07108 [Burkholderia lata]|uniref:Uncharacterized protein n=1 Tax=Burkholderia lata (strain ATCC 17760 / DSM 23089 / LMG 22485 / NCIMB 9086 / R18194 / 383) TaxID=482957 RepID=A0A6P2RWL0_BURL3|nr:hypothetical protein BLA15816_07108 [Burkholderia lata]VWC43422.1 hypothetical protein BLA15945_07256 [Burkholderia lata]